MLVYKTHTRRRIEDTRGGMGWLKTPNGDVCAGYMHPSTYTVGVGNGAADTRLRDKRFPHMSKYLIGPVRIGNSLECLSTMLLPTQQREDSPKSRPGLNPGGYFTLVLGSSRVRHDWKRYACVTGQEQILVLGVIDRARE